MQSSANDTPRPSRSQDGFNSSPNESPSRQLASTHLSSTFQSDAHIPENDILLTDFILKTDVPTYVPGLRASELVCDHTDQSDLFNIQIAPPSQNIDGIRCVQSGLEQTEQLHSSQLNTSTPHQPRQFQRPVDNSAEAVFNWENFCLPNTQADCVLTPEQPERANTGRVPDNTAIIDSGYNGEGITVQVVESILSKQMTRTSAEQAMRYPVPSSRSLNPNTAQPSPMSCVTQTDAPIALSVPPTPQTPSVPASTSGGRRGRKRSLSSPNGLGLNSLPLPTVPQDVIAKHFEQILRNAGKDCGQVESSQMFKGLIDRASEATEAWKKQKRKSIKETNPSMSDPKSGNASRMEAQLSRYTKDVYIVALQDELKRMVCDFVIMKQVVRNFLPSLYADNPQNNSPSDCIREGDCVGDIDAVNTVSAEYPPKKARFE